MTILRRMDITKNWLVWCIFEKKPTFGQIKNSTNATNFTSSNNFDAFLDDYIMWGSICRYGATY